MTAPWLQGAMIGVPLGGQVLFFSQTGMLRGPAPARPDRTIGPESSGLGPPSQSGADDIMSSRAT